MTQTYPLRWPDGWQRTPPAKRSRGRQFKRGGYEGALPTFAYGRDGLIDELTRLGAKNVVISSSVDVRVDGVPRAGINADATTFREPGVAVYFTLNNRATVMAQDGYDSPAVNLRSLTLAIEAMRALERHGGGTMMNKAFDGFAALPPPAGSKPKRPWWEVLRYPADPTERDFLTFTEVQARYRGLAMKAHPDQGGSHDAMAELNDALADAEADLKAEGERK